MTPSQPIGVSDLRRHDGCLAECEPGIWFWCRQHERAEHVSEPTTRAYAGWKECIRIGPFMSEREALRLSVVTRYPQTALGVEIEE